MADEVKSWHSKKVRDKWHLIFAQKTNWPKWLMRRNHDTQKKWEINDIWYSHKNKLAKMTDETKSCCSKRVREKWYENVTLMWNKTWPKWPMRKIKDIDKRQGIKKNDMCMIGKKWGQNLQETRIHLKQALPSSIISVCRYMMQSRGFPWEPLLKVWMHIAWPMQWLIMIVWLSFVKSNLSAIY